MAVKPLERVCRSDCLRPSMVDGLTNLVDPRGGRRDQSPPSSPLPLPLFSLPGPLFPSSSPPSSARAVALALADPFPRLCCGALLRPRVHLEARSVELLFCLLPGHTLHGGDLHRLSQQR